MSKSWFFSFAGLVLLSGCQTSSVNRNHAMKFGPPPPGYVKIVGEPVPGWKPADMLPGAQGEDNPMNWYQMGPRPILGEFWSGSDDASGRVVSIAVDPTNGDIAYAASASGGMWKTVNGGATWDPMTDELSILNHGCVVLDPSDPSVVYLGTGEYTTGSSGDGLFRSVDGGVSFERIGTTVEVGGTCSKIAVDPTDPNIIHVTSGNGYTRTIDGGANWQSLMVGSYSDLALNPVDPSIVYAARKNVGIFRSTDGGASFSQLTNGLPSTSVRRILLSISASNPSVLYTAIINPSNGLRGFYKTTDGGDSWIEMVNTPNFPSPQGWYDCFVGVDPTDEDVVYCGGVFPSYAVAGVIKTTNGGLSWTDITVGLGGGQLHPDQHTVTFGPDGRVWVGNDGGIWNSDDGGFSWTNRNDRLMVTQNYNIAVHPSNPDLVMGGTQDNGTVARDLATDEWPQIIAGDGGFLMYDFDNPARRYTTYVFLTVFRLGPGGAFAEITGPWGGDPTNFIAPLVMDPNDARTLLGGTNRVWRTTNADAGANWTAISSSVVGGGGRLNAIAVGATETEAPSNNIYTGSTTGRVYFTSDASNWQDRSDGLPSFGVSDIMVHPTDAQIAYVSFYRSTGNRVFRTIDAGVNWTGVTGDLPAGVVPRALAVDWSFEPPVLYVGSGSGVWASLDGGDSWIKDGQDLPNVNVGDLYLDPIRRELTVGTYGRGAWRSDLADACPGPVILEQPEPQTVCLGDSVTFEVVATTGKGAITYQWRVNGEEILGATESSYTVDPVVNNGDLYDVLVGNDCTEVLSDTVVLIAMEAAEFTAQPQSLTGCSGDAMFPFVSATGDPEFQWFRNGEAIEGATSFFLSISPAYPCFSGEFTVEASNMCGTVLSESATIVIEGCGAGDTESDGDVDMADFAEFQRCFTGSDAGPPPMGCEAFDFDEDDDIDGIDWCSLELITTGPADP